MNEKELKKLTAKEWVRLLGDGVVVDDFNEIKGAGGAVYAHWLLMEADPKEGTKERELLSLLNSKLTTGDLTLLDGVRRVAGQEFSDLTLSIDSLWSELLKSLRKYDVKRFVITNELDDVMGAIHRLSREGYCVAGTVSCGCGLIFEKEESAE